MKEYKYKAFISYSHKDAKIAKWLHRSLEKYKIPKELRETYKNLPDKLYPIFRDREELPTSFNLSQNIIEALRDSKYLIVVCSIDSAKSFWVNKEIIDFKTMHGEDRILAIIINGEPNAKDLDKFDDKLECFPEALKYKVIDGKLTNKRTEPIAGDIREGKDGKEFAKLKLIAGLLGIGFEELYRREEKRKRKNRFIWGSFAIGLIVLFSELSWYSLEKKKEAEANEQKAVKQTALAKEQTIIAKSQTALAIKRLKVAEHNIGLALLEKAQNHRNKKELALAHYFAYNSLLKLKNDSQYRVKAKNIILNSTYSTLFFYENKKNFLNRLKKLTPDNL